MSAGCSGYCARGRPWRSPAGAGSSANKWAQFVLEGIDSDYSGYALCSTVHGIARVKSRTEAKGLTGQSIGAVVKPEKGHSRPDAGVSVRAARRALRVWCRRGRKSTSSFMSCHGTNNTVPILQTSRPKGLRWSSRTRSTHTRTGGAAGDEAGTRGRVSNYPRL